MNASLSLVYLNNILSLREVKAQRVSSLLDFLTKYSDLKYQCLSLTVADGRTSLCVFFHNVVLSRRFGPFMGLTHIYFIQNPTLRELLQEELKEQFFGSKIFLTYLEAVP